jgi:hypothetical protein
MKAIERKLIELKKKQPDIGVATISLNRLPIFQPSLRAVYQEKTFESQRWKVSIRGRLGQNHKGLIETILYLRKLYDLDEENMSLRVLYSEYEVKKYLSQGTMYSHERYQKLMEDLMHASILVQSKIQQGRARAGTFIKDKKPSDNFIYKTKSNLPSLRCEEIHYTILEFGEAISYLFAKEFKFTYDPKPIISLRNGISQALVRFLITFTKHPSAGYHLQPLIEHLEGQLTNKRWWKIREYLKEDIEGLENLGIVIDFKKDRLFVIENLF